MQFSYTAIDKTGKRMVGEEQAKDQYDLAHVLKERGLALVSVKEKRGREWRGYLFRFFHA